MEAIAEILSSSLMQRALLAALSITSDELGF